MQKHPLVIGISGASGIIYGVRLLKHLKDLEVETHLVVSKAAQLTRALETSFSLTELKSLSTVYHPINDLSASIASGSFKTAGMIVAPCSMKTLSEIAHGFSNNLLTRAADVTLKERRRLVILPREAPLHLGHLQNMQNLTQMGGIIFPPTIAFYNKPQTLDEAIDEIIGRVLNLFSIDNNLVKEWRREK